MVVLETLSPLARAAFILYETFGSQHSEIARTLGRSPAAVRRLIHRARGHVQARRPRFSEERATAQAVAERFLDAALGGSIVGLMEVLAPDVTLRTDGGGPCQGRSAPHHRQRAGEQGAGAGHAGRHRGDGALVRSGRPAHRGHLRRRPAVRGAGGGHRRGREAHQRGLRRAEPRQAGSSS
ncbi:sigma factor-like helix-turn-helix DNA-binding protein [Nonomuraea sp. MG754425]|uniref:sigma factor-like helix-turn-helix DNA-binding protein n=1 Tax=Nonomuraea sp. MG754425 TaxID=2570319 RepID=UPI002351BE57|nr:sigma factor-like helix-turn-helix DNA-binding protein [Nonomuraea sp. MG754425]